MARQGALGPRTRLGSGGCNGGSGIQGSGALHRSRYHLSGSPQLFFWTNPGCPGPQAGAARGAAPSQPHPRPARFLEVSERGPPSPGARVPGLCIRQSGCQGTSLSFVPQSGCHLPHARHCAGLWGPQSQAEPGMASTFAELPVLGHAGFEQKATATRGNCSLRPAVKARPQRSWVDAAWGGREGPRSC